MDRLTQAQQFDIRYHQAKLFGLMMTEEGAKYAWQEHQQVRAQLLAQNAEAPRPTFDDVIRIHQRMQAAGLIPPTNGEMN